MLGGILGDRARRGHDQRDRVADEPDVIGDQCAVRGRVQTTALRRRERCDDPLEVGTRQHECDAGERRRRRRVDRPQHTVRGRATYEVGVQHPRGREVVDERPPASEQSSIFDATDTAPHVPHGREASVRPMTPVEAFDLSGRVACVTGAASGIGEASARMLAAAGAHVVLGDVDGTNLARVVDDIVAGGGDAIARRTDIRVRAELDALVAAATDTHGRLDVMCNIAGVGSYGALTDVTDADVDRAFGINVKGTLYGCQAALAAMAPRRQGSIVNVSATAIYTPAAGVGIYAATKAAVAMLTQTLAVEAGAHGIRVNAIAPGFTVTNFVGGHLRDAEGNRDEGEFAVYLERMRTMSPLGLLGEADDQAYQVLYLASDASRFVTGAILRANGGQSIDW